MSLHPTHRFSNRVQAYRKYRPVYPEALLDLLASLVPPADATCAADIGSGTGIFARQLLDTGYRVIAIEPNAGMRAVAIEELGTRFGYTQSSSAAEATALPDASIDLITAAQAFHWFDVTACHREFRRILKPGGIVAIIWNDRIKDNTPFAREYERLLHRYGTNYSSVDHALIGEERVMQLWGESQYEEAVFPNMQLLDREGLHGRVASVSFTPAPGEPGYEDLHTALDDLFDRCSQGETVALDYECRMYFGSLT